MAEEMRFNFPEGRSAAVLQDKMLRSKALAVWRAAVIPWMNSTDEENEVIRKHAAAGKTASVGRLDAEDKIGRVVIQQAARLQAIARLDYNRIVREAFAEFPQDGRQEVARHLPDRQDGAGHGNRCRC